MDNALRQITLQPTPGWIFETLLDATRELIPFERGAIFKVDETQHKLFPVATRGLSAALERQLIEQPLSLSEGLFTEVYRSRQPLEIPDTAREPRLKYIPGYTGAALACYPMIAGERVLAMIDIDRIPADQETRLLITMFYNRAAIALQNALLYEETVNLSQQRAALLNIATQLSAAADSQSLRHIILENTRSALDLDGASLGLVVKDPPGIEILANHFAQPEKVVCETGQVVPLSRCHLAEKVLHDKTAAAAIVDSQANILSSSMRAFYASQGVKSLLMAPLVVNRQAIGVLIGFALRQARLFSETDLSLAQGIANQAAVALQRAQLSELLQQSLQNTTESTQKRPSAETFGLPESKGA